MFFFQNQSDQYVNDYGNNQRYSPAIYTHCYDTSGTRLFAAGGPLQIGLKGNYLSLFQWRNLELHYMSFLFSQKTLLSKDKKLFLQDSHLHSLLLHQWYQTGGPKQIGLKGNYLFISVTEPGIELYVFSVPFQKHKSA